MAKDAKTSGIFGAVAGALAGVSVALTPAIASADGSQPATMTQELQELDAADRAATAYASEHGVAILLHVGLDIQNHEQSEAVLQWVQDEFRNSFAEHGLQVEVFPRINDAPGTVLTYHVGDHIYSPPGADPILNLEEASELVADVAEQGRIAVQLAFLDQDDLTLNNPG